MAVTLLGGIVLALAAIAIGTKLHERASDSRDAQVALARAEADLNELQALPWVVESPTPDAARREMDRFEGRIERRLGAIRRESPTPELDAVAPPLRANFARLERVRVANLENRPWAALRAMETAVRARRSTARALAVARGRYRALSTGQLKQARIGSAGAILALLGAFFWFYRRSVVARGAAEMLAQENAKLLDASQHEALTDALTGLPNRRALLNDLAARLPTVGAEESLVLGLFDLDGFKEYNDTFGHPAGDALLTRLGARLRATLEGIGTTYRMGGDEFCTLASIGVEGGEGIARLAAAALSDSGDAFNIGCSYGLALMPSEASTAEVALRLADQRMYEQKAAGRRSASRQSADVLLKVLGERTSGLEQHAADVATLAQRVAEALELPRPEVKRIRLAAELHDVGKMAVPDAILAKPGPLDESEWKLIRHRTVVAERIIHAAPSLAHAAELVRSSPEHFDGSGYPDGLRGEEIQIGSRIIAVCDALYSMTSPRPYRETMSKAEAVAELRRCAGTQFDPRLVEICCTLVEDDLYSPANASRPADGEGQQALN